MGEILRKRKFEYKNINEYKTFFWGVITFQDFRTRFALKILIRQFERFEDSLSSFRNQDNLFQRERESPQYLALMILNGLII